MHEVCSFRDRDRISAIACVWYQGVGNCSFCSDMLCCSGLLESCFSHIGVSVVDVLSSPCDLGAVFHTSCIRVPVLGCLLYVLACACPLNILTSYFTCVIFSRFYFMHLWAMWVFIT